jgi:hypothetical protein
MRIVGPVLQADDFEMAIDVETTRTRGLAVPPSILARADCMAA